MWRGEITFRKVFTLIWYSGISVVVIYGLLLLLYAIYFVAAGLLLP